jgi:hypothetical protein
VPDTLNDEERREERRLIADGAWPLFPVLPIKRSMRNDGLADLGIILWRYGIENGPITVYEIDLWSMQERGREVKAKNLGEAITYAKVLDGVPSTKYATLDEFFDDGWRGD